MCPYFRYDEETPSNSHLYLAALEDSSDDAVDDAVENDVASEAEEDKGTTADESDGSKEETKSEDKESAENDEDFYKCVHIFSCIRFEKLKKRLIAERA